MGLSPKQLPWILLAVAGCSQAPPTGVSGDPMGCGDGCGKTTIGGRSGGGPSSGGVASSSSSSSSSSSGGAGSTSTGGSSSGSSGGLNLLSSEIACESVEMAPTVATCSSGASFSAQLVDYLSCSTVGGAAIGAIGVDGVPFQGAAVTSASDGNFALCLPSGSPFSIQIGAPSYPTTYYAEMLNPDAGDFAQMVMLSNSEIGAFAGIFPGGSQPGKALIATKLTGINCFPDLAGWTFDLSLPDGGPLPDGGYQLIYLDSSTIPDSTLTATSNKGAAILYNIDPSISDFLTLTASNPDAGSCTPINSGLGFTGRVYVTSDSLTVDPFLLP